MNRFRASVLADPSVRVYTQYRMSVHTYHLQKRRVRSKRQSVWMNAKVSRRVDAILPQSTPSILQLSRFHTNVLPHPSLALYAANWHGFELTLMDLPGVLSCLGGALVGLAGLERSADTDCYVGKEWGVSLLLMDVPLCLKRACS